MLKEIKDGITTVGKGVAKGARGVAKGGSALRDAEKTVEVSVDGYKKLVDAVKGDEKQQKMKMKAQGLLADILLEGEGDEYLNLQTRCNKLRRKGERREDGQAFPKDEKLDLWVVNAAVVPVETLAELTEEQEERYREKIRTVLQSIAKHYEGKTTPEEIAEADNKVLNKLDSGTDDKFEGILNNVAPTVKVAVEKLGKMLDEVFPEDSGEEALKKAEESYQKSKQRWDEEEPPWTQLGRAINKGLGKLAMWLEKKGGGQA